MDGGLVTAPTLPDGSLGGPGNRRWVPDPRWRLITPGQGGARPPGAGRQRRSSSPGLGDLARPNLRVPRLPGPFPAPHRSHRPAAPAPGPEPGPYAGPSTDAQLMALRHLEYIAAVQSSARNPGSARSPVAPPRADRRGSLAMLWDARRRLLAFAANGAVVFVVGLAVQFALIKFLHLSHVVSYVIQTVFSVQLNFALSRLVTWRDRAVPFAGALVRYNVQQLAAAGLGMALYAGLDRLGMHFPESNIAVTLLLTPVTFVLGHRWSMAERPADRNRRQYVPPRRTANGSREAIPRTYAMQFETDRAPIANHFTPGYRRMAQH